MCYSLAALFLIILCLYPASEEEKNEMKRLLNVAYTKRERGE
jgi:hypothetical protein